ncbi:hypothetical protein AMJ85_07960 [candidate division BRC1 bacterium SM23_51]|nr:MAG: hypothetical protein AMJ85_07960 [candidate division BRC1 bacterium SM23_51]
MRAKNIGQIDFRKWFLGEGTFLQKVPSPTSPSPKNSPFLAFLLAREQESEVQAPSGMALGF